MSQTFAQEHARRRARERLGIKLTRNIRSAVCHDILAGRAVPLDRNTWRASRAMYMVEICGRPARVVFCHESNEIVTVMRRGITL